MTPNNDRPDATPSETPVYDRMCRDLARVEAARALTDDGIAAWLEGESP